MERSRSSVTVGRSLCGRPAGAGLQRALTGLLLVLVLLVFGAQSAAASEAAALDPAVSEMVAEQPPVEIADPLETAPPAETDVAPPQAEPPPIPAAPVVPVAPVQLPPMDGNDAPPAVQVPPAAAEAVNKSKVVQVVWQVQRGCRSYCHGTSQTQTAGQQASTHQRASAQTHEVAGAAAVNESFVAQLVWQIQFGCEEYCFDTSQAQIARQQAAIVQAADALSPLGQALASNVAHTLQLAWQVQFGCLRECHGTTQSQSLQQQSSIDQLGFADGGTAGSLPSWLTAFASNLEATIQLLIQYQEAGCESHCTGDSQTQVADQLAEIEQAAVAGPASGSGGSATPPPAPVEPPNPPTAVAAAVVAATTQPVGSAAVLGTRRRGTILLARASLVSLAVRRQERPPRGQTSELLAGSSVSAAATAQTRTAGETRRRRGETDQAPATSDPQGAQSSGYASSPDADRPWNVLALAALLLLCGLAGAAGLRRSPAPIG